MNQISQLDYDDIIELKLKLQNVLSHIQQENQERTAFYHAKISQLYDQIAEKDAALEEIEKKLEAANKKCMTLQWALIQKQQMIDHLNSKFLNIRNNFKENINPDLQSFHGILNDSGQNYQTEKASEVSTKRINISEYFIKLTEGVKIDSVKENKQGFTQYGNSTNATLIPENSISTIQSNKVPIETKQLDCLKKDFQIRQIYRGFKSDIKNDVVGERIPRREVEGFMADKNSGYKMRKFLSHNKKKKLPFEQNRQ